MAPILVGGAGIGGLAAAISLARRGMPVTVIERRPVLAAFGAGIQLAPNATRVLADLDLLGGVEARATEPTAIRIRRARDGTVVSMMPLADARQRYGSPFLLIHRADLQRVIVDAAQSYKLITLLLGAQIARETAKPGGIELSTKGHGETFLGDGFIDARGIHALRQPESSAPAARLTAWRALIAAHALAPAYRKAETNLWLGPQAHLVHYPLNGGRLINVVAITPRSRGDAGTDPWSEPGDPARLRQQFRAWHPDATALLAAAAEWRCWPLFDAPPAPFWGAGASTRLGDAAHPMLPFLAQGASQAIEDAGVLGEALVAAPDVAAAFRLYEHRRAGRVARVQRASRRQGDIYHLGRPASDARDFVLRTLGGRRALSRMDWLYKPL